MTSQIGHFLELPIAPFGQMWHRCGRKRVIGAVPRFRERLRQSPAQHTAHGVRCAPAAGFYFHLQQELCTHPWPNVVELMPDGMCHAGVAMLRHAYCSGPHKADGARILTSVKNLK